MFCAAGDAKKTLKSASLRGLRLHSTDLHRSIDPNTVSRRLFSVATATTRDPKRTMVCESPARFAR